MTRRDPLQVPADLVKKALADIPQDAGRRIERARSQMKGVVIGGTGLGPQYFMTAMAMAGGK